MLSRFSTLKPVRILRGLQDKRDTRRDSILFLGLLYVGMALVQCALPYMLFTDQADAWKMVNLPVIGWIAAMVDVATVWCILHLFCIGVVLIRNARDTDATIRQTPGESQMVGIISRILALGILVSVLYLFLYRQSDRESAIFFANFVGLILLRAGMEAIFRYHRM